MNAACQDRFRETRVRTFITVEDSKVVSEVTISSGESSFFSNVQSRIGRKKNKKEILVY